MIKSGDKIKPLGSGFHNFLSFLYLLPQAQAPQESRPIWIRVFYISGFPLQREQAWIPAWPVPAKAGSGNDIFFNPAGTQRITKVFKV